MARLAGGAHAAINIKSAVDNRFEGARVIMLISNHTLMILHWMLVLNLGEVTLKMEGN